VDAYIPLIYGGVDDLKVVLNNHQYSQSRSNPLRQSGKCDMCNEFAKIAKES
jgi:hypothetical protein